MGLRSGWLALFVFVWIIGAFLGSTFEYQSSASTQGMTYSAGTGNFTTGSAIVIGSGTVWSSSLMAGGLIKCNDDAIWYKIYSVNSTTNLTLTSVYAQAGGVGKAYTMQASPGWTGSGSGGYAQAPITTMQYLTNISNIVQRKAFLGSLAFPVPNADYFRAAFKVVTWQWSFLFNPDGTMAYGIFYWVFCAPFVIMGVLSMVMIIYQTIFGTLAW